MNQKAYEEIISEISFILEISSYAGMDHIDEEKLTGLLMNFTVKNYENQPNKPTDIEIKTMVKHATHNLTCALKDDFQVLFKNSLQINYS